MAHAIYLILTHVPLVVLVLTYCCYYYCGGHLLMCICLGTTANTRPLKHRRDTTNGTSTVTTTSSRRSVPVFPCMVTRRRGSQPLRQLVALLIVIVRA